MASIEEAEDWESLPADLPASIHMSAGALAGIAEHCILFPIDTVKTRMQVLPPIGSTSTPFSTIYRSIRDICVADGPVALWRGLPSLMLGVG
jgi:solute carrier family 25 iron transporter 28/37